MLDRESTFQDQNIVRMLQEDFIPVAIDQWYTRQKDDDEGRFYRQLAAAGGRGDFNQTTQGFYIATAGGELLYYNNNRGPDRIKSLMRSALARKRSWVAKPIDDADGDPRYPGGVPEDAVVVQVNSKVLDGYAKPRNPWSHILHAAIGRDNLWIRSAELKKLQQGEFPESLATKVVRFHLLDNTRGEAPMWREEAVKQIELNMDRNGIVTGTAHLESARRSMAYQATIAGKIEFDDGNLTRFDLVAKGNYQGEGPWTGGAPAGDFPFAVAFRLADPNDLAYGVRPQAIKAYGRDYFRLGTE